MQANLITSARSRTPDYTVSVSISPSLYCPVLDLRPFPQRPSTSAAPRIQIPAAQVNSCDAHGKTPLHCAVEEDDLGHIATLLRQGADPNLRSRPCCDSPLHTAIRRGQTEVLRLLLENRRIDVNRRNDDNKTPLLLAIEYRRPDMVAMLVTAPGIDVNAGGSFDDVTPLYLAAEGGQAESAIHLLNSRRIDINKEVRGITPIEIAVLENKNLVLNALLQRATKDDVKRKNDRGETPLALARQVGNSEAKSMLYKRLGGVRALFYRSL